MKSDNLFDTKFTFLDFVKIMLLVVTGFSTFNIVDIITPDGAFAVVREWAAVLVVEGAFIGFELATSKARNQRQVTFATIGFFCSLLVIGLFAAASGLLEFGGNNLVEQPFGSVMGLSLTFGDAVAGAALAVLVGWILTLAAIYRFYSLNDPDMRMEIRQVALNESVDTEAENALKVALQKAAPTIASGRALASVQSKYADEMSPAQMQAMMQAMSEALEKSYAVKPDLEYRPAPKRESALSQLGHAVAGKVSGIATRMQGAIPADPKMPLIPKELQTVGVAPADTVPSQYQDPSVRFYMEEQVILDFVCQFDGVILKRDFKRGEPLKYYHDKDKQADRYWVFRKGDFLADLSIPLVLLDMLKTGVLPATLPTGWEEGDVRPAHGPALKEAAPTEEELATHTQRFLDGLTPEPKAGSHPLL